MSRNHSLIGIAVALALAGGMASAQTPATHARVAMKADPAAEAQLAAAQRDLDQAMRRVAELNHQLGRDNGDGRTQVIEQRMVLKPALGVVLAPDAQAGVRVAAVTPDSGAARAGLKTGDRLTSVDGTAILGSTGALRVDNARTLLADLDAGKAVRIGYARDGRAATASVVPRMDPQIVMLRGPESGDGHLRRIEMMPGMAPGMSQEIIRIGPRGDCKGQDCKIPMMAEAFRWNGLNLASVDAKLGRYFGTDRGVLVLSAGPDLADLQAGDVIQKIDGHAVGTPREAMDVLRDKPANALALVEYMRDRKLASTRIKVPMPFKVPMPPMPPMAPMAPLPPVPAPPPPPRAPKAASIELVPASPDAPVAVVGEDGATIVQDVQIVTQ